MRRGGGASLPVSPLGSALLSFPLPLGDADLTGKVVELRGGPLVEQWAVTPAVWPALICEYIQAEDGKGNFSVLHPNITFYVEQHSALVDDQGPQLKGGWSSLPRGAIEFVEVPMIECQIFVRGRRTAQHDDAVLHHLYLQVGVGEKVFDVVLEALIFLREGVRDLHRYRGECRRRCVGSRRYRTYRYRPHPPSPRVPPPCPPLPALPPGSRAQWRTAPSARRLDLDLHLRLHLLSRPSGGLWAPRLRGRRARLRSLWARRRSRISELFD